MTDGDYMDLPLAEQVREQIEMLEAAAVEELVERAARLRRVAAGENDRSPGERASAALFAAAIDNHIATGEYWYPDILHVCQVLDINNRTGGVVDLLPALFQLTEPEA